MVDVVIVKKGYKGEKFSVKVAIFVHNSMDASSEGRQKVQNTSNIELKNIIKKTLKFVINKLIWTLNNFYAIILNFVASILCSQIFVFLNSAIFIILQMPSICGDNLVQICCVWFLYLITLAFIENLSWGHMNQTRQATDVVERFNENAENKSVVLVHVSM